MTTRQCFPCTACCEGWLRADINGEALRPGKSCQHLGCQGCGIYRKRPEDPCVLFMCGWLDPQNALPTHMKPSECGAILRFPKWGRDQVVSAIPIGRVIPDKTIKWLKAFARKKSIPLIFSERLVKDGKYVGVKKTGYGPPTFIHSVESRMHAEDVMTY